MVPLDHPSHALDMISRFLRAEPFADQLQNQIEALSCRDANASAHAGIVEIHADCDIEAEEFPHFPMAPIDAAPVHEPVVSAAAKVPPTAVEASVVGMDSVSVAFAPGDGGDAELSAVEYLAVSSPDGVTATGHDSPITVEGLVPGRTYTFSVTEIYSTDDMGTGFDGDEVIWSGVPSVGSAAVTPGCLVEASGAAGESDPTGVGEDTNRPRGTLKACGGHGVCVEGGSRGKCLCHQGYAGEACESVVGTEVNRGDAAFARAAEGVKTLHETELPALEGVEWVRF